MKRALISDIHGNLEALNAVLEDIGEQDVEEIYCLGDIIGYGPNPCECLDLVMERCRRTILGNHDQAALFDPDGFNEMALRAIYWTRDRLDEQGSPAQINARWDFLGELPRSHDDSPLRFVHGSPRDPTNEYVFPETIFNESKLGSMFAKLETACFMGHTHIPGVFTEDANFIRPAECDFHFHIPASAKVMVNVGSVGQPRDENNKACYVVLNVETHSFEFRRIAYDYHATIEKIYSYPELDDGLGDRLRRGH